MSVNKVRFAMEELEDLLDRDAVEAPGIPVPGKRNGRVILIVGPPGSGKSTLALQMAWGINVHGESAFCLYFALEQSAEQLKRIVQGFEWGNEARIRGVDIPADRRQLPAEKRDLAEWFQLLCKPNGTDRSDEAAIIVPKVTPRSLAGRSAGNEDLFMRRLQDVHFLLDGYLRCRARQCHQPRPIACCYGGSDSQGICDGAKCPPLGMVVIDSLNVFGQHELDRNVSTSLRQLLVEISVAR